jgi:hypothetical protein
MILFADLHYVGSVRSGMDNCSSLNGSSPYFTDHAYYADVKKQL